MENQNFNEDKLYKKTTDDLNQPVNEITEFGKGFSYKSVDGKEWASIEEAMAYNQLFFERMKNREHKKYVEEAENKTGLSR